IRWTSTCHLRNCNSGAGTGTGQTNPDQQRALNDRIRIQAGGRSRNTFQNGSYLDLRAQPYLNIPERGDLNWGIDGEAAYNFNIGKASESRIGLYSKTAIGDEFTPNRYGFYSQIALPSQRNNNWTFRPGIYGQYTGQHRDPRTNRINPAGWEAGGSISIDLNKNIIGKNQKKGSSPESPF
ncbi:MAG: hypothetical protein AAF570_25010, partial [Bacteroidota bacterium]